MPLIGGEEALVVWDPASQVEHFIRRADFRGVTGAFGFIVPTPSQPTMHEADDDVFARLAQLYSEPARQSRRAGAERSVSDDSIGSPADAVQVVATARVAGMDATVLRANNPQALARWLGSNGFDNRPALANWLRPYTTGTWHVTAFRYAGSAARAEFGSRSVRLTFRTARPFYPFAEPQDQRADGDVRRAARPFRVSVVSSYRVAATVGAQPWPARVGYAERRGLGAVLAGAVPDPSSAPLWMTTFDEPNTTRGADDLWFARAPSQTDVAPSIPRVR